MFAEPSLSIELQTLSLTRHVIPRPLFKMASSPSSLQVPVLFKSFGHAHMARLVAVHQARACARLPVLSRPTWVVVVGPIGLRPSFFIDMDGWREAAAQNHGNSRTTYSACVLDTLDVHYLS
jgi:hypothetical protein